MKTRIAFLGATAASVVLFMTTHASVLATIRHS